jgi:hypothetical protein
MADNYRFYVPCPACGGTGLLNWGASPSQGGTQTCTRCAEDEGNPLGPREIDGLRHVYAGRFAEVEDE